MMDESSERMLRHYLEEIESELERLPRSVRREIIAEIRSHLVEEWRRCSKPSEENMLNIINSFGEPVEIAAGYLEGRSAGHVRSAAASYPPSWLVIVLTVFLWPAGIILAWLSPAWRSRDKLIATLIPLVFAAILFLYIMVERRGAL